MSAAPLDTAIDFNAVTSFGEVDADLDPLLDTCFESHRAYLEARGHGRFLILGRKGSGKTAIFRKLQRLNAPAVFCQGHVFSDYPWHHHAKQNQLGVPVEQCFIHSWEYLIYVSFAKILLNDDESQPWSDQAMQNMAELETFVTDTYGTRTPTIGQIFSPTKHLKLKGEFGIDWRVSMENFRQKAFPWSTFP